MENLIKRLEKRGWGKEEIIKAMDIINSSKHNRSRKAMIFDKQIYYILLAIIAVANFAISIALIPILMALEGYALYFIIIILGIAFGFMFELVIRSIEHLERAHHEFLAILIPLIALANALTISKISNNIGSMVGLKNFHEPLTIALIYSGSFVLPYIIYRFILKVGYYTKG